VRFLVDHCAGRRLAEWLKEQGHDVLEARDFGPGTGDPVLLARAASEQRILVSLDKHFGQHVFLHEAAHSGLVRLPDVPAAERIHLMSQILAAHAADLEAGRIVTVKGSRIRVSLPPAKHGSQ
jgi:predicted nuclease of predicted toxin-antitoxin system